jgi:hypothetical protein
MVRRAPVPQGRPSSYRPEYAQRAYNYALLGATDEQMIGFFDTTIATFYSWKKHHPEFLKALSEGKHDADANVARSVYKNALGYSHPETKVFVSDGIVTQVPVIKHYPPNQAAGAYWLSHRQPEMWRERIEITTDPKQLTDEQIADELARRGIVIDGDFQVVEDGAGPHVGPGRGGAPEDQGDRRLLGVVRPDLLRPRRAD